MAKKERRSVAAKADSKAAKSAGKTDGVMIFRKAMSATETLGEEDLSGLPAILKFGILGLICLIAFFIRLFAVVRYESVIHEFDPYFNFRTTKYLAAEGFLDFLDWFDDRAWYPLGRTIGGTIYPGLMFTAATIYWILNALHISINIRNMCVFLAPLFAANTAIASYLLTTEITKRSATGLLAAAFTAVVPSYISRSVGGSYDNEGVAIFALIFVFYMWIKAVHTGSMFWAALTALSYFYMVAAWGGYVFIINMIPIHVVALIVAGRYSSRLYVAYSTFYAIGSLTAMMVPFVGFNVVQQAECMASHGVFAGLQVYAFVSYLHKIVDAKVLRRLFVAAAMAAVGLLATALVGLQLMGKVQWTGRSLTLLDPTYASKYIPIIASVSEHQPTTWTSYFFDLHILVPLAPVGLYFLYQNPTEGAAFIVLYGTVAWYFAGVMVRLMLTLAPVACILAAVGFSKILQRFVAIARYGGIVNKPTATGGASSSSAGAGADTGDSDSNGAGGPSSSSPSNIGAILPRGVTFLIIGVLSALLCFFGYHASYVSSLAYSSPSIVIEAGRYPDGTRVLYDDYREAYYWLRHNTDPQAKILSWWDYGYQMSAMANRTVLVDNNTWNNTHIATVGRALASTEEKAYPILQSLDVDYVLVIFGGMTGYSSDDINKFLWPVRIGSGVFPNDMHKERDFLSPSGNFDIGPQGSKVFHNCLAYKLCFYRFGEMSTEYGKPPGFDRARGREVGVRKIKLETMEEAFTSEHWIVRIYKVKKPANVKPAPSFAKLPVPRAAPSSDFASPNAAAEASSAAAAAAAAAGSEDGAGSEVDAMADAIDRIKPRYVGCFSSEGMFGPNRQYVGGSAGAHINQIKYQAVQMGKRYFAVGRHYTDGHGFVFDSLMPGLPPNGNMQGGGCERPCADSEEFVCGCTDGACSGPIPKGEEHNRRWAVYELPIGRGASASSASAPSDGGDVGGNGGNGGAGAGAGAKTTKKRRKRAPKGN